MFQGVSKTVLYNVIVIILIFIIGQMVVSVIVFFLFTTVPRCPKTYIWGFHSRIFNRLIVLIHA